MPESEEAKAMMKQFIEDRNQAFVSLDKTKIIKYCEKYHIQIPIDETIFWSRSAQSDM